ncbi:MAG: EF-P beta-lysylation protein EpmB, partial [Luteimonas sp.]
MITAAPRALQPGPHPEVVAHDWKRLWREAIRDPRELLEMLGLDVLAAGISAQAAAQFPLRVPHGFVARMRHGDPNDPLLRQVLPVLDEERVVPGFVLDA